MAFDASTKCVYNDHGIDEKTGAVNPPIYQSAGFSYPDPEQLEKVFKGQDFGFVYSRISNPTIAELERRIAYLDSALGVVASIEWVIGDSFAWFVLGAQGIILWFQIHFLADLGTCLKKQSLS